MFLNPLCLQHKLCLLGISLLLAFILMMAVYVRVKHISTRCIFNCYQDDVNWMTHTHIHILYIYIYSSKHPLTPQIFLNVMKRTKWQQNDKAGKAKILLSDTQDDSQ